VPQQRRLSTSLHSTIGTPTRWPPLCFASFSSPPLACLPCATALPPAFTRGAWRLRSSSLRRGTWLSRVPYTSKRAGPARRRRRRPRLPRLRRVPHQSLPSLSRPTSPAPSASTSSTSPSRSSASTMCARRASRPGCARRSEIASRFAAPSRAAPYRPSSPTASTARFRRSASRAAPPPLPRASWSWRSRRSVRQPVWRRAGAWPRDGLSCSWAVVTCHHACRRCSWCCATCSSRSLSSAGAGSATRGATSSSQPRAHLRSGRRWRHACASSRHTPRTSSTAAGWPRTTSARRPSSRPPSTRLSSSWPSAPCR
jgi:hypothetical protein